MKTYKNLFSGRFCCLFLIFPLLIPTQNFACTIVSAIACNGEVWNMNNEDGPFGVANFINVFPKTGNNRYGYYTLSYFSPELGDGGSIQGGTNEAGLTFDFNAIDRIEHLDLKEAFPPGDDAILPYILSTMSTVEEVIAFFEIFWFQKGFSSAQMHVADRQGRFAIISASGIKLVEKGQPLVSTNFDICANEESSSCWRYPIATSKLSESDVDFKLMRSIAIETAQKNGATMYTNIQNLSTGELWFFSKHDSHKIIKTKIIDLLGRGRRSYSFGDLRALIEDRPAHLPVLLHAGNIADSLKLKNTGNYYNSYTGCIQVNPDPQGINLSFTDGRTEVFFSTTENVYFHPDADVQIKFNYDEMAQKAAMDLYENGYWTFRAWEKN